MTRRRTAHEPHNDGAVKVRAKPKRCGKTNKTAVSPASSCRAIDYWRRQAVERRYVNSTTPAVEAETAIDEGRLFDSKVLKPVHRACLILRYAHGMDRREIAEYTGLTADRVKSYLQYARQLLRVQLLEQPGARR